MEELLNPDKLVILVLLLVPGFVSIKVWDLMVPSARRTHQQSLIDGFTFGFLNFILFFWLLQLISKDLTWNDHPVLLSLAVIGYGFVGPFAMAASWLMLRRSSLFRAWAIDPTPTAWDFFFRRREKAWVLIHLKNGSLIGGYFGQNSYVSSYSESPDIQDIYIERVWSVDGEGRFLSEIADSEGALISNAEIEYFEFFEAR